MKLFKKNRDETLENAIEFMQSQKRLNKQNMKTIKNMNFAIDDMKEWDKIYSFIISTLKSMRKWFNGWKIRRKRHISYYER